MKIVFGPLHWCRAPSPPPAYTACCHEPAQYSASPMQHSGTVQQYHTQFVKEGLKLKVKQKIKEEPEEAAEQRRQGVQADLGNLPIKQENEVRILEYFEVNFINLNYKSNF